LSGVSFSPPDNYGVGPGPASVVVSDFNGDGKPDLAVANRLSTSDSLLLGNGDGTFQSAQSFAVPSRFSSLAVGDFNGDGKADLAETDDASSSVNILLGNGDGTFQAPLSFPVGNNPGGVVVGDFNGDGKPDLAVNTTGGVSVFLGNGDGTFRSAQNLGIAGAVVIGDFNGDGKADLAVTNVNGLVSVFLGNGDGTFQAAQNSTVGSIGALAVGDFNGDGRLDLVVTHSNGIVPSVPGNTISVLLGNGDGTFQPGQQFSVGDRPTSVAVGDFNGDGKLDVVTANFDSNTVSVLLGNGDGTFQPAQNFGTGSSPVGLVIGDFNGDGRPDLAVTNEDDNSVSVLMNQLIFPASAVNSSAIAGAPFNGAVATFTNPLPSASATSYTATIDWGDGSTSSGTISGTGTLTANGPHTYADPGTYAVTVVINGKPGFPATATVYPTVTVTTLGQGVQDGLTGGIGFWHSKNGQALIDSFNGGPDATALSSWLAAAFPNLYGNDAVFINLTSVSNAQVAAFYQSQFAQPGSSLGAELLATALNVYATTQSLGGTIGQTYGFTVTATGLGAASFNVGGDGAAFGVADNSTRNVYELLVAVDRQASLEGGLFNGDATLLKKANDLFDALNRAGAIR
jgi:hypothetical protein